jgi:hypothetical protein
LLVSCGREVLAGILRPGNAGANNAEDHLRLLDLALGQLPCAALHGELLARSDSAGASHDLADACRETGIRFSFGYPLTEPVRQALQELKQSAWRRAIGQDDEPREEAWVTELTEQVNLGDWPERTRLIAGVSGRIPARSSRSPKWTGIDFSASSLTRKAMISPPWKHAPPAQVEDRIKALKHTGANYLPFHAFDANAAWLELALAAHDVMGPDAAAHPRRRAPHLRTQTTALPGPARRRPAHPTRPPDDTAPSRRLAMDRSDPQSVRMARHAPRPPDGARDHDIKR